MNISFPNRKLSKDNSNGNISFIAMKDNQEIQCVITTEVLSNLDNSLSDDIIFQNHIIMFQDIAHAKIKKTSESKIVISTSDIPPKIKLK